jgi:hypothetical protein
VESLVEKRTRHFYEWERRGRGWQAYPFPVAIEPPFVPFRPVALTAAPVDDGRHPTAFSRFFDRLRGTPVQPALPAPEPDEPAVEPHDYPSDLVELRLFPPRGLSSSPAVVRSFLRSLYALSAPASFEFVGSAGKVALLLSCRQADARFVGTQLAGFIPELELRESPEALLRAWGDAVDGVFGGVEFGLEREFMVPLATLKSLSPDPLTSIFAALAEAHDDEFLVAQVLFEGVSAPWAESVGRAVVTPSGQPFFADAPEVTAHAREKVSTPLFAVGIRSLALAATNERVWTLLRGVARTLASGTGAANTLIPLGEGDHGELLADVFARTTHRSGMLLSLAELATLVHLPTESVPGVVRDDGRTKRAPPETEASGVLLGHNTHRGETKEARLSDETRMRHVHVIGASGTGKSTLLVSMILDDIAAGHGVAVIDPHGDLVDEVLARVHPERFDDVILFDPSDPEYVVGWNMLSAGSEAEKEMLASDLVAVFRRLSTSWGDQMTAVLANAIAGFLDSERGGTLVDLRRFLSDNRFRETVLSSVRDPQAREFWKGHFPLLSGKPQASILTRLDTLLRGRLVRGVVTATEHPLDFRRLVDDGRILLAKLSQGAVGQENAALLGSLLVSKIHQVCLLRQDVRLEARRPFFLYADEFHDLATPSMAALFSGARKYRLGVTVAHQDLYQLHSAAPDVERAALANAHTRICFRVGEDDARTLSRTLSFFTDEDLANLETGEAICRIGRRENDFNLRTTQLDALDPEAAAARRSDLREHSLRLWGVRRQDNTSVGGSDPRDEPSRDDGIGSLPRASPPPPRRTPSGGRPLPPKVTASTREPAAASGEPRRPGKGGPEHTYLQELIKRWAEERGFRTAVEEQIPGGTASVDIALYRGDLSIACEITVTTPLEYEVGNVEKCLAAGFSEVVVVSLKKRRLEKLDGLLAGALGPEQRQRVHLLTPEGLLAWLAGQPTREEGGTVGGYKVKVRYQTPPDATSQRIAEIVARSMSRMKPEEE